MTDATKVAEIAARAAGEILQGAVAQRVVHKGVVDLVTEIDLQCEAAVLEVLARLSPGVPVLAEEGGGDWDSATRWIVDPLDGTTNFVHGFPSYGTAVALVENGIPVAGCIFDPLGGCAYTATRDGGAFCNGERIRVSTTADLSDALLLTGFAYDRRERAEFYLQFVRAFLERAQGIRRAGAASIDFALVATGRADGFWEFGLKPWDVAAGMLLVDEAGGRVTDMSTAPLDLNRPRLLASNGLIHSQMHAVLQPLISST